VPHEPNIPLLSLFFNPPFPPVKPPPCAEEAITIEGRHSSLAEFLTRQPAEEVTAFFTDIVALLERRGIGN
jgi:hypothetical protein